MKINFKSLIVSAQYYENMHCRPYQKLIVWQEAHQLCKWTFELTKAFPVDERFRLVHQICKSAYSVPMNIAEGSGKLSKKEREHFYETASCSLEELHYQFFLSQELHYIAEKDFLHFDDLLQKVSYLLTKLRQSLH